MVGEITFLAKYILYTGSICLGHGRLVQQISTSFLC